MYPREENGDIFLKHKPTLAFKIVVILALIAVVVFALVHYLSGLNFQALNPKGVIALHEKNLLIITCLLSLFVVIPVFTLLIVILVKYRAGNEKAVYKPEWGGSNFLEGLWWGIPCVIIIALSIITGISTHALDPTKPIASSNKPVTIEVVALQWKWLFIYPEQNVATVNYIKMPVNTPVHFDLTADAPMNSFWIPSLGGQIYAMPGMTTQLNLMATTRGTYNGSSANISGDGFAGMKFSADAVSATDFQSWVAQSQQSKGLLDDPKYLELVKPTSYVPSATYGLKDAYLYDKIVSKYMSPEGAASLTEGK